MERQKVEERRRFSKSEKITFLNKSNFVCSHCGKKLDLSTVTVEHALPVGEGGRNDDRNLVALCKECNRIKANKVTLKSIPNYYKYLNEENTLLLLEYAEEYNREFEWFSWDNWFEDDMFVMTPKGLPEGDDWIKHKESLKLTTKVVVKKAWYSDLQGILDFYIKRGNVDSNFIKKELNFFFLTGAVYAIYNASSEVVGAFCVSIAGVIEDYTPCITHILYSKKYHLAMQEVLSLLMNNIKKKSLSLAYAYVFSIYEEEGAYDVLNKVVSGGLRSIPNSEVKKQGIRMYFGASAKSNTIKGIGTDRLAKMIRKNAIGYKNLLNNRKEELRRVLSNDLFNDIVVKL